MGVDTTFEMPGAFRDRLRQSWPKLMAQLLNGTQGFPLEVKIKGTALTPAVLDSRLMDVRTWTQEWRKSDMDGYVAWTSAQRRGYGEVFRPAALVAPDLAALGPWIGREPLDLFDVASRRISRLTTALDHPVELGRFAAEICALEEREIEGLILLVVWRRASEDGTTAVRETAIPGLDTKWVEGHLPLVEQLFKGIEGGCREGATWPERLGFRLDDRRGVWLRFHPDDMPAGIPPEIAVRPSQMPTRPPWVERVLVVENRTTFLSVFPSRGTLVIAGDGNLVSSTVESLAWLADLPIHYWGDCDSFGYRFLGRVRQRLPHTVSLLMDAGTVAAHQDLAVPEPERARLAEDIPELTPEEARARQFLADRHLRLEQERIEAAPVLRGAGLVA